METASLRSPSSWTHNCGLESDTLGILLEHHGNSLHDLTFERDALPWKSTPLVRDRLKTLGVHSLEVDILDKERDWPSLLVARNCNSLRNLQLGRLSEIIKRPGSSHGGHRASTSATRKFFISVKSKMETAGTEKQTSLLKLESLELCGLDFNLILTAKNPSIVDFANVRALVLESCFGIEEAFLGLRMGTIRSNPLASLRLKSLIIRHENANPRFLSELERFLCSLPGLRTLHVLLDGSSHSANLEKILKVHGKSLRSLVWDDRELPREFVDANMTSENDLIYGHLGVVSRHCHRLRALGLSLDWKIVTDPKALKEARVINYPV